MKIFSGNIRERFRAARNKWRNDGDNGDVNRPHPVLATPFVPSIAAHREAVQSDQLTVDELGVLTGGELRVKNYVISVAASAEKPVEAVLNGRAAENFAESIGADLERVKLNFQQSEEEWED